MWGIWHLSVEHSLAPVPLPQYCYNGPTLPAASCSVLKSVSHGFLVALSIIMSLSCQEPLVAAHCLQGEF